MINIICAESQCACYVDNIINNRSEAKISTRIEITLGHSTAEEMFINYRSLKVVKDKPLIIIMPGGGPRIPCGMPLPIPRIPGGIIPLGGPAIKSMTN